MNLKYLGIIASLATAAPTLVQDAEDIVKALEGNTPLQQKAQNVLQAVDAAIGALIKAL